VKIVSPYGKGGGGTAQTPFELQWFVGNPQQSASDTHVEPSATHELPDRRMQ
jgi:hypothetical protein